MGLQVTNSKFTGPGFSINQVSSKLSGDLEPLLKFKWVCDDLPFGHDVMYVESISLPMVQFDKHTPVFGGAQYAQYPGFSSQADFSMNFYEDSRSSTLVWLTEWQKKIKNFANGGYYLPKEYKKSMVFTLIDTTGVRVLQATLQNVWPVTISDLDLDWTSNERIVINVTFTLDNIYYHNLITGQQFNTECKG